MLFGVEIAIDLVTFTNMLHVAVVVDVECNRKNLFFLWVAASLMCFL